MEKLPYSHRLNSLKAEALFIMGEEEKSRALTSEFLNTPAQFGLFSKAHIYAWRGEKDEAFQVTSFTGGLAAAYVFLHLFSELDKAGMDLIAALI